MRLTTKDHINYWKNRKIDWKESYFTPDHPHRDLIIDALHTMKFSTVYEIGCGAGANLWKVIKHYPNTRVGGVDVNEEAIEEAKKNLPGNSLMETRSAEDIFMNDKSIDVLLSDMCSIYFGPLKIDKVIKEIKRVTRNNVIFVEFHSRSFWSRLKLFWKSGYNAYNWPKLLRKHGFYDIEMRKL